MTEQIELSKLRDQLRDHFNLTEIRDLCFDLGINDEVLTGSNINDQTRELVSYCRRHGHVIDLIKTCQKLRPHVEWHNKQTINSLLETDTFNSSKTTLMDALANEVSNNLISVHEFVAVGYKIERNIVLSSKHDKVFLEYFTCMTHVYDSMEVKKILTIIEPKFRRQIDELYRHFMNINNKANSLLRAFRFEKAQNYIDTIDKFNNELMVEGIKIVEILTTND